MKRLCMKLAHTIDRVNHAIGRVLGWLVCALVLIGSYNTLVRYAGRWFGWQASSNAYLELQWYLFSVIFLLGMAYNLRHNAHVRVDVLYGRLSPRAQNWINILGTLLFLIPFCWIMLTLSMKPVVNAWSIREMSPDPGGLPRYPIKTMIPIAFALLLAQAISETIKNIVALRDRSTSDTEAYHPGDT